MNKAFDRDDREKILDQWISGCQRDIRLVRENLNSLTMQIEHARKKLERLVREEKAYLLFKKEISDED